MRISDWSSDVCSSDLIGIAFGQVELAQLLLVVRHTILIVARVRTQDRQQARFLGRHLLAQLAVGKFLVADDVDLADLGFRPLADLEHDIDAILVERDHLRLDVGGEARSEEHTSELQSLMRISYAVFCLKKKTKPYTLTTTEDKPQRTTSRQ